MPVLPVSLITPLWDQFSVLLPSHPVVDPTHPLGCHRRRVADRVVFDHVLNALVHGSGYERIATPGCSDRTIRRRVREWADAGLAADLQRLVLEQYDWMIGLDLATLAVDGWITKAPCGGDHAGRSPVDRGKQGLKRSLVTDGAGIPLCIVAAGANGNDGPLLGPTLAGLAPLEPLPPDGPVHLDRGYDNGPCRVLLANLGLTGVIARRGLPAPTQAGPRWVVERTHAWMNAFGKLRRCTERITTVINFYLSLAAAIITTQRLIASAREDYRWATRPTTRRLR